MSQETMTQAEVARLLRGEHVPRRPTKQPCNRLEITIPIPPAGTKRNGQHGHWQTKHKATKQQRRDAGIAAGVALMHGNYEPPRWQRAEVQATFYRARTTSRADDDNLLAWLKASLDGLQDAGIVANDVGLTHLPPVQVLGKEAEGRNEVVLNVVGR